MSGALRRLLVAGVLLISCGGAMAQVDPAVRETANGSALRGQRFHPAPLSARKFDRAARHTPAPHRSGPPAQPASSRSEQKQDHGIYTWSIFGFTEGSDTDVPGGKSLYNQTDGRLGRSNGGYWALESDFGGSYSPNERMNLFVDGIVGNEVVLNGPSGALIDNGSSTNAGVDAGIKYQIFDRKNSSFGLAFQAAPYYTRTAPATGPVTQAVGSEFRVLADTELVPQTLFGAVNVAYTPEAAPGSSGNTSTLEASAAIARRAFGDVYFGAETRYLDKFDGLLFGQRLGWALYAGPTLYVEMRDIGYFGVAWSIQLAGRAAAAPDAGLDLSDFERNQIRVKLGFYF